MNMALTTNLAYTSLDFYERLVKQLPGAAVYDTTPHAVGYTGQPVTITIAGGTPPWTVSAGGLTWSIADRTFKVMLYLGMNDITVVDSLGEQATLSMAAYNIHTYLAMYALECLTARQNTVQVAQSNFLADDSYTDHGVSYDVTLPWIEDHFGGMLHVHCPQNMSLADYQTMIATIFEAYGSPSRESIRLVAEAVTGQNPTIIEEPEIPGMKAGECFGVRSALDKISYGSKNIYMGTKYWTLLDGEFKVPTRIFEGNKPGYLYIEPRHGTEVGLQVYSSPQPIITETCIETVTNNKIMTDTDGSITGIVDGLYCYPTYFPISLTSVVSTGPIGVENASITTEGIINLNVCSDSTQLGDITLTYEYGKLQYYIGFVWKPVGDTMRIYTGRVGRNCKVRSERYFRGAFRVLIHGGLALSATDKSSVRDVIHRVKPAYTLAYVHFGP